MKGNSPIQTKDKDIDQFVKFTLILNPDTSDLFKIDRYTGKVVLFMS